MPEAGVERGAGRILGRRYELGERIGGGASAEVFRAFDRNLGRDVAVKQLRSHLSEDARFVKLFRTEAHLVAQLDHPNVVTVFDWSSDDDGADGGSFIVTELLEGGTLRDWLKAETVLSIADAAFVGLQVAQGLHAAHQAGLVHRDIKPANLLFGREGRLRIADFGIARAVAEASWTEPEGRLIGTARYAAPEQAETGAVDGLADVYSLAVCLIEAVTGDVPLVGDNAMGTMVLRSQHDLPVDAELGPLSEALEAAGCRDRTQRSTSLELRDSLLAVCRSLPNFSWMSEMDLTEFGGLDSQAPISTVRFEPNGDLVVGDSQRPPSAIDDFDVDGNDGLNPDSRAGFEGGVLADEDGAYGFDEDVAADGDLRPSDVEGLFDVDPDLDHPRVNAALDVERRDKRPVVWTLIAAALIGLGVAGFFGLQYWESLDRETELITVSLPTFPVGDYRTLSVEEVRAEADANGWSVEVSETFDDETAEGELLGQTPDPGTMMMPGGAVQLEVSRGPRPRTLPTVVGSTEDEVSEELAAADLLVGQVDRVNDEEVPAGEVLEASVEGSEVQPGAQFPPGTPVDLVVSSGPRPRTVPGLVGMTVEAATVELENENLRIAIEEAYSESVDEGLIVSARPPGATEVTRGSTVTVTVSLGLPFVTVPDLAGQPVAEANEVLESQGFSPKLNGVLNSTVLGTRPGAGASLRLGSVVEIISVD